MEREELRKMNSVGLTLFSHLSEMKGWEKKETLGHSALVY